MRPDAVKACGWRQGGEVTGGTPATTGYAIGTNLDFIFAAAWATVAASSRAKTAGS
jgi:hypothetical protein